MIAVAPLFCALVLFLTDHPPVIAEEIASHEYVGSETCSGCHEVEADTWKKSHHAKAWMMPSKATVAGDFEDAEFTHLGRTTRFFRKDGGYFIETTDITGGPKIFSVKGAGGVYPLQQYLIETEPGRLQSLDIAWDQEKQTWYHLYENQELKPDDAFHWSGPYKNWNARCAECHATGFEKNYSLRNRQYTSSQAEIGVGCEACHGPGQEHVAWAKAGGSKSESQFPEGNDKGLMISFLNAHAETEIQQCAGCHSRREPYQDGNPLPGTPYHDAYRLALLREGLYHADGQILDEVYVYGSFLQSKMYQKGVRCSDCHDPHSGNLRADGNAVCTQCHSPAGNDDFPSLQAKVYDGPEHHFHGIDSGGAKCVSCHMIERTYMGIDGRRDHSFRVPRPDLSVKLDTPDACTDCHQDKSAEWAAGVLEARFPDSPHRGRHFAETFAAARRGSSDAGEELMEIALHEEFPDIVRASALDLMPSSVDPGVAEAAANLLQDDNPLVRAAALKLQERVPVSQRLERVLTALEDPVKSVRIEAARQLLALQTTRLPGEMAEKARKANREWQASLAAKADFPETHLVIGGTALAMRNWPAALAAFKEAVVLDPQLVDAWSFQVRINLALKDLAAAEFALQRALVLNPGNAELLALKAQFPR